MLRKFLLPLIPVLFIVLRLTTIQIATLGLTKSLTPKSLASSHSLPLSPFQSSYTMLTLFIFPFHCLLLNVKGTASWDCMCIYSRVERFWRKKCYTFYVVLNCCRTLFPWTVTLKQGWAMGIRSFAQIALIKWAMVSNSLRSLRKNEQLWANRSFFWANCSFAHKKQASRSKNLTKIVFSGTFL